MRPILALFVLGACTSRQEDLTPPSPPLPHGQRGELARQVHGGDLTPPSPPLPGGQRGEAERGAQPSAASSAPPPPPPPPHHTPLTASAVARLRGVLERSSGRRDVFAKVGDSITVSGAFLRCFEGDDIRWGEHASLRETRDFFAANRVDDRSSSFGRGTLAARVGWRTVRVLEGSPPPLLRELDALRPAWAVVMLGTNDTYPDAMQGYAQALRPVIDTLLDRGVIPLLSTIPPRRGDLQAQQLTPEMNAVVRMVARSRGVPLMDLFGALDPLPNAGLNRDGVHPDPLREDRMHPCWFDERGLRAGMNVRNLLVLQALDRVRRKVLGPEPPDEDPPADEGDGTWERPRMLTVPGESDGDTRGGPAQATSYRCGKEQLPGPERVYRVEVPRAGKLRVRLFSEGKARLGLRWLSSPSPERCEARARTRLDVDVTPGVHWLVVDSVSEAEAGRYGLTALLR